MSKVLRDPDILDRLKKVENFQRDAENGTVSLRPDPRFLPEPTGGTGTLEAFMIDVGEYAPLTSPQTLSLLKLTAEYTSFGEIRTYLINGGVYLIEQVGGPLDPGDGPAITYYDYDSEWWRIELFLDDANWIAAVDDFETTWSQRLTIRGFFAASDDTTDFPWTGFPAIPGLPPSGYGAVEPPEIAMYFQRDASDVWQAHLWKGLPGGEDPPLQFGFLRDYWLGLG